jgi:hypothetical protein
VHRALRYLRVIYIITVKTFLTVEGFFNAVVYMHEPFDNQALADRACFALDSQDDKNQDQEKGTI